MFLSLRLCIALVCCAVVTAVSAQVDTPRTESAREIERSYRGGERTQAMERLDRAIEAQPRDAQLRFLKAVLLAESGLTAQASEIYLRLTQEYPELPEPYNNLAVLYAAQGQFDKARDALETALRNDPAYATAHENLGDVYVRLALQSYERAGTAGTELQRKLQLARQLAARPSRGS